MRAAFADSLGQPVSGAAPSRPKAKSHLATGFPDTLKVETINADKKPLAASDYGMYANVVVNGKVVASLSNSGCCAIADGYGISEIQNQIELPGDGPKLAQRRAEIIAQALGGKVEKLSTAQSPEDWAKTGKRIGMADMRSFETAEQPNQPLRHSQHALDLLLQQQEASDEAAA